MNIRVIALSAALLLSTGAFAQTNAPANPPNNDNGTSMSTAQPNNANNGAMTNTTPNGINNSVPVDTTYGHNGGGNWGLWGLLGLFGFFGLAGGRRRADVVRTSNLPPR